MKFKILQKPIALLLFFSVLGSISAIGQNTIRGQVTSDEGEPLIGVTVAVKNRSMGIATDVNGNYSLSPISSSDTLVFTYSGFNTQTLAVGANKVLNVIMTPNVELLSEVVVVGYGTVRKSDLTGSVATLSGNKLEKIPVASVEQAMTGRLPGVNVLTTDGSPDAEVVIRVRGGGSITQDNSPLFVVDGFIVSSIRDIPPADIESISVLKDASATAIYGAQASNGVVVITTKRPLPGKISVTYNGFAQSKFLPSDRKYEVLSPYEYVLANYEYAKLRSDADLRNFEKYFGKYDDLELYKQKAPTDWQDELFGNPNWSQFHNIGVSGGTENTKISLSLTNNTDEGLLIGSGYTRNVINFKLNQKISKKLSFDASTRITNTEVDGNGTANGASISIKEAVQTRPINGIADELDIDLTSTDPNDDYQSFLRSLVDPTELAKQDWRKRTTNNYVLNAALKWSVLRNLDLQTTVTTEKSFDKNLRFYGPLTSKSFNEGSSLPLGDRTTTDRFSYRWLNTLTYEFENLRNQNLDILLGHEIYSIGGNAESVGAKEFRLSITPEELFANMALGTTNRYSTSEFTDANRISFFGRVNYQLNNKYLFTFTMRSDASSKFSEGNRVGIFPAAAIGWKISEEGFLKDVNFINELKLRASYGETGNDRISSTATQFLFEPATSGGAGFGNVNNVYYKPSESTLYNPDLKWETTVNRNIGLDFLMFQGKLAGSLDFYKNTTRDLLLQSAIPSNTGFSSQWNNIGSTSNRGVELGITAYLIDKKNFSLSANVNIGINRAKVEELDGTTERFFQSNWASTDLRDQNDFYLKVGGTLGDIYGYVTDGYYSTNDFDGYDETTRTYLLKDGVPNAGATVGNQNVRPGFLKLKDLNDDGIINSDDRMVIGNTLPKHQGGFGFDARFHGFDAAIFFNWSYGNDVYNTGKIQYNQFRRVTYGNMLNTMNSDSRFTYIDIDGSYTGTAGEVVTDLGQLAQLNADKTIWSHNSYGVAGAVIHSWAVEDGSFLRLNNINIGYSLPSQLISRLGMSQFRVYVTGNNLHLWTKYSGFDPEVSTSRQNSAYTALTPGVDYSSYPRSRSYTFGLNITF
ncbi:MAG: TonB-dependent receptor [Lewinellaceae bacterium]|nr:TonB-dependent receptor [Lewinellaceae bacterium]